MRDYLQHEDGVGRIQRTLREIGEHTGVAGQERIPVVVEGAGRGFVDELALGQTEQETRPVDDVDGGAPRSQCDGVDADDVAVGSGAWTAVHHAFTAPKQDFGGLIDTDPGAVLADAYDIVCNGHEIGGGSVRIHRRDVQEKVFAVMGIDQAEAGDKFGFLLEAFTFGAPPHGGIAFGWDRITALLFGADSIRDVIAFPKSGGGVDPLTDAPAPITAQQRKESGMDFKPEK